MRKKRPCSECRRWFYPDVRVGARQRACSDAACQRSRHRRADRAWHERHPEYDRGRRWQAAIAAVKSGEVAMTVTRPAVLAGVPWDVVQDEMRAEAVVIIAGLAGVLVRHAQDEMRRQVLDMTTEFRGVPRPRPQDEMEVLR